MYEQVKEYIAMRHYILFEAKVLGCLKKDPETPSFGHIHVRW